jgi:hypothetical protein
MSLRARFKREASNSGSDSETLLERARRIRTGTLDDSDKPPNVPSPSSRSRSTVSNKPPSRASDPSTVLSHRPLRHSASSPRAGVEELMRRSIVRSREACGERAERPPEAPPGEKMRPDDPYMTPICACMGHGTSIHRTAVHDMQD